MNLFIPHINREISWLSFNERVLQEASDNTVPLIERLRFLGIFSNNQDEFFRVRIATLKRLLALGKKPKSIKSDSPAKTLAQVQKIVLKQSKQFDRTYNTICSELQQHGIFIINETQLETEHREFVKNYFIENVRPTLVPIMLNQVRQFPELSDQAIYLALRLSVKTKSRHLQYALIKIPTDTLERFVVLPSIKHRQYIMLLDDIIRYNLPEMFSAFTFNRYEAYTIKVTRDAELDIDNDIAESFLDKISKSVKARQKGATVRLVYDNLMPKDMRDYLQQKMKLKDLDDIMPGSRYHNFKDFMKFPNLGGSGLRSTNQKPLFHPALLPDQSFFTTLKKRDLMLHYPYQSFSHFIDLLREAAMDPQVKSIKITLYRLARNSMVINALVNAAKNGKQVTAVVELQARFDEEANIKWAQQLQDEGIRVIYGVPGLKVHAKLCLITRAEGGKNRLYANLSTGNYNENTAQLYADDSLFTSDSKLTNEVEHIFDFLEKNYKAHHYQHLMLSPLTTRKKMIRLIENEITNARAGKRAELFLKLNSLVDEEMIEWLYKAGKAGVKIRGIVRGICALIPGKKGWSENIEIISIVDRYLEHARIIVFHNNGDERVFLSSADWMVRNLDYRIEVTCPVYDVVLKNELLQLLELQWADNVKARIIDEDMKNHYREQTHRRPTRAQQAIYLFLKANLQSPQVNR